MILYPLPQCGLHRGVEQLVARRAHNPEVVGSSPSPATKRMRTSEDVRIPYGGVAQLARAFGSYPECHVFESHRRYQNGASKKICARKAQTLSGLFVSRARSRHEWLTVDI